ncbi:MAG TPA: DUF3309 family protein [Reyranella sp.]|nr:DUF3309 family protein [Reyranella sp.]
MLLGLAVILATVGVVVFPRWRYSRRWSYAPSAAAGVLLVVIAAAAAAGRPASESDIRITKAAPAPAGPSHNQTIENARERLLWSGEPSMAAISVSIRFD